MAALKSRTHIFFDLDDTLWDFRKNSGEVLAELFEEHLLSEKLQADFARFHEIYMRLNLELWNQYYKGDITKEYLRNQRFNLVFNKFGYDDYEGGLRITEQYLHRAPRRKHLKEGCIEILDTLSKRYHLHIITNGFREVQATKIDGCALRNYFGHIIVSEEHGFVKPDTRIFRLAEKLAGAAPQECVMVGDSYESDIVGGMKAGWEVIYFSDEDQPEYTGHRISRLHDLIRLL